MAQTITLEAVLKSIRIRKSQRQNYLKIIELVASSSEGATSREIEQLLGKPPQTVNPILQRLMSRQVLSRELRSRGYRKYKEFRYFLSPAIPKSAIADLVKIEAEAAPSCVESQPKNIALSEKEQMQLRLSKLPIFDPFWSEEVQKSWLEAVAQFTR